MSDAMLPLEGPDAAHVVLESLDQIEARCALQIQMCERLIRLHQERMTSQPPTSVLFPTQPPTRTPDLKLCIRRAA